MGPFTLRVSLEAALMSFEVYTSVIDSLARGFLRRFSIFSIEGLQFPLTIPRRHRCVDY